MSHRDASTDPDCRLYFSTTNVKISRAAGTKCARCWKYTEDTGADAEFPTICAPCAAVVREMISHA